MSPDMPAPRSHHAACMVGDRDMVVVGGVSRGRVLGDVCVLDTATMRWKKKLSFAELSSPSVDVNAHAGADMIPPVVEDASDVQPAAMVDATVVDNEDGGGTGSQAQQSSIRDRFTPRYGHTAVYANKKVRSVHGAPGSLPRS